VSGSAALFVELVSCLLTGRDPRPAEVKKEEGLEEEEEEEAPAAGEAEAGERAAICLYQSGST
jgi:hypothetical protein